MSLEEVCEKISFNLKEKVDQPVIKHTHQIQTHENQIQQLSSELKTLS